MHPIMSGSSVLMLSVAVIIAGVDGAIACGNGKLIFEDKFEALDPAWGLLQDDPQRSNGPGGLTYKWPPKTGISRLNQSGIYDNYEVCAVFTTDAPADSGGGVAVIFWASDFDNLYGADVYPVDGKFDVYRMEKKKWLTPVSSTSSPAIAKGTSVTNEISVTVNG
ncbi:MAG: hypothetical protein ACRD3W_30985, partial [Terriglobales bacterium]